MLDYYVCIYVYARSDRDYVLQLKPFVPSIFSYRCLSGTRVPCSIHVCMNVTALKV